MGTGALSEDKSEAAVEGAPLWTIAATVIVLIAVPVGLWASTYSSPLEKHLAACDAAIQSTLKAPATYKRLESPNSFTSGGPHMYQLTYEAQNLFGVPLRSSGYCTVDGTTGLATWLQSQIPGAYGEAAAAAAAADLR